MSKPIIFPMKMNKVLIHSGIFYVIVYHECYGFPTAVLCHSEGIKLFQEYFEDKIISEKERGELVEDLLKTGLLMNMEEVNDKIYQFSITENIKMRWSFSLTDRKQEMPLAGVLCFDGKIKSGEISSTEVGLRILGEIVCAESMTSLEAAKLYVKMIEFRLPTNEPILKNFNFSDEMFSMDIDTHGSDTCNAIAVDPHAILKISAEDFAEAFEIEQAQEMKGVSKKFD